VRVLPIVSMSDMRKLVHRLQGTRS
jgi:hypothetical protein